MIMILLLTTNTNQSSQIIIAIISKTASNAKLYKMYVIIRTIKAITIIYSVQIFNGLLISIWNPNN